MYFDNLTILHKKSNVSELNDYYPFGLLNQSQSQTSLSFDPMNNYQYQSKELQSQLGLNTLDFGLRHYDATLGRWGVQDPMMQYFNPYVAMGNNPVSMIDPDGGKTKAPKYDDGNGEPLMSGGGGGSFYSMYMQNANMDGWFSGYYSSGGEDINWSHGFTDASGQFISNTQFLAIQALTQNFNEMKVFLSSKNISLSFNSQSFANSFFSDDFEFNFTKFEKETINPGSESNMINSLSLVEAPTDLTASAGGDDPPINPHTGKPFASGAITPDATIESFVLGSWTFKSIPWIFQVSMKSQKIGVDRLILFLNRSKPSYYKGKYYKVGFKYWNKEKNDWDHIYDFKMKKPN